MERDEIKAGALLSYANLIIGNLIPFIYTPIMLQTLGQTEYGIYGIAQSVMGYVGLLNFGIGGTIVRYLARYNAENDFEGERRIFGLFIKIYSVIGLLVLAAGLFCSFRMDGFARSLDVGELALLKTLVRLMTLNMAVFMPFNVFSSMIIAHERFIFSKSVALISGIAAPCLNLALLIGGLGSVGLVISSTILNCITYVIYFLYVTFRMGIRPSLAGSEGGLLMEILRFSSLVFIANIVDVLFWSTDKLIIGWAVGPDATAVYNVGAIFNGYVTSLSAAISGLLMPKVAKMAVNEEHSAEYTKLFIKTGRMQFILVSFIVSAFILFGRQFIGIWAGAGYEEAYYIALLVMIPVTVPLIQNTGLNILYAENRHGFRSAVYFIIAIVNVILTFFLVENHGIIGAAVATCLSYIIGNIIIINWYYYKKVGIDIPGFWKNIAQMCPGIFVVSVVGRVILDRITIGNWRMFFLSAAGYSIVYFIAAYAFMMNEYEKSLVADLIARIVSKRGRYINGKKDQ